MLTEKILYEQTYNTDTTIVVKQYTVIYSDEVEISRSQPYTHFLAPGSDYSNEDEDTRKMCAELWNDDIIQKYQAKVNDATDL